MTTTPTYAPVVRRTTAVAVLVAVLVGCGQQASPPPPPPGPAAGASEREQVLGPFLAEHWRLPVPPQGPVPDGWSDAEASLDPASCGACHPLQYAQWRTSLHAVAFSPGFAGQLIEGELSHPAQILGCQTCHAPLSEQQPHDAGLEPNADFDPALRAAGIVCASCHVRAHRRLGPPRRGELPARVEPVAHGGFEEREEYLQSRFCAECHQFFDDAGVNGKPLENTFAEWRQSPQAAAGRHCQDCHMPDRAHLWRGIHDPEIVRAAVDVALVPRDVSGHTLQADLVVANRDVGHAFPSYITPRVFVVVQQVDAEGRLLPGTQVEGVIGREVDLAAGVEHWDTRILPGESTKLEYRLGRVPGVVALVGRVTVDPDFHYRGLFEQLQASYTDPEALRLIEEAVAGTSESMYVLSEVRLDLR